jgi:hypothetical protein
VILDTTDLKILREFWKLGEGEETTSWRIMKSMFPKGDSIKHNKVKKRIEKMSRYGLFQIRGNPKEYILCQDKVICKKIKYDGKYAESVCFFADGKWSSFEI